ncbi:NRPS-like enzyme [Penicillium hispanicum]|uniref:NRPS-like enzyme n=1 Tax=Penicillium hispanicum TaxID=1080232 RepID=UPI00254002AF|nr:NRPS-like enzyme [Penicillium hispanicum]KAJ5591912.1 NRPS-like enzyme [Penicillium hispanicum]
MSVLSPLPIVNSLPALAPNQTTKPIYTGPATGLPNGATNGTTEANITTLLDILDLSAQTSAGVCFYSPGMTDNEDKRLSYKELASEAERNAQILLSNIGPLDQTTRRKVLIHMDNQSDNIRWFWSVVSAGLLPVMSTPLSQNQQQREQHLQHLRTLLENPIVLTSKRLVTQFPELEQCHILTVETLESAPRNSDGSSSVLVPERPSQDDEPAVLMLTSGSTGHSKAVPLTVPQMLASVRSKGRACGTTARSVLMNWIGLDHVANLLEIHLHAMAHAAEQIQVPAGDVIAEPLLFLRLIHRHRVTLTFAPNFFLSLLSERISNVAAEADSNATVDLSSLEKIVTGGEANVVDLARTVTQQLVALGSSSPVLAIAYGLTEACAALSYGMLDLEYEEREKHEFATVGVAIDAARVRIQSTPGVDAEAGQPGEVQLAGEVVFKEYYRNPSATSSSFTADGWFRTGDRGYLDSAGRLNLMGRDKEILIINGRNYSPQDIETALDKAAIAGTVPTYFAAFSHRPIGGATEGYCVLYGQENAVEDPLRRDQVAEAVASVAGSIPGARPHWVIPVPTPRLQKSSLGKLSRSKLKTAFLAGNFDDLVVRSTRPIQSARSTPRVPPQTPTEQTLVDVVQEMLELPAEYISVDQTIFELGLTSISLFRFEQLLRKKLNVGAGISLITFLNSPVIQHIAHAIDNANSNEYDPVVLLQPRGDKPPLWLVHPASGNVLSFLPLSRAMTDRPLYALTMRGLEDHGHLFSSIAEMADTYYQHIKRTQPTGPYALAGYSLGTTVAFELAKRIEAGGDTVAFCGGIDSPPHVIPLMQEIDWTATAIRVAYFLALIGQDDIPKFEKEMQGWSLDRVVEKLFEVAQPEERTRLNLNPEQLIAIVYSTENFASMARQYHPAGSVEKMDIFYCVPLRSVCTNKDRWLEDYLGAWANFSRQPVEYTDCEGEHADMLNPQYVEGFEERLSRVLAARGL